MFCIGDLEDPSLRVIQQKDLAIAIGIIAGSSFLGRDIAIRNENDEAAIGADVAHSGVESRSWIRSYLDDEWIGRWARRLGRDGGKRATDQSRHYTGAQKPENLLHRFLRNKNADTSRLDAIGELSSVERVKRIIAATGYHRL